MIKRCLLATFLLGCPAPSLQPPPDAEAPDAQLSDTGEDVLPPDEDLPSALEPPHGEFEYQPPPRTHTEPPPRPESPSLGEIETQGAEPSAVGVEFCNKRDDDKDGRVDEGVSNRCGRCGRLPSDGLTQYFGNDVESPAWDEDCDGKVDEGHLSSLCAADEECQGELFCHEGRCTRYCNDCWACDRLVSRLTRVDPESGERYVSWRDDEMMLFPERFEDCASCPVACGDVGGVCKRGFCRRDPRRVGVCREGMREETSTFVQVWLDAEFDEDGQIVDIQRLTREEVYCGEAE